MSKNEQNKETKYSRQRMVQVSYLYYKRSMNQKEIADLFDVSAITISRILDTAKKNDIVTFNIDHTYGRNPHLEEKAEQAFPSVKFVAFEDNFLDQANSKTSGGVADYLGEASSSLLKSLISDESLLGIGGGKTLSALVNNIREDNFPEIREIIQLIGGYGDAVISENSSSVIHRFCQKLHIPGTYLLAPAICEGEAQCVSNPRIGAVVGKKWHSLDAAIMGIGEISKDSTILKTNLLNWNELEELSDKGAVGDIGLHFFDLQGEIVDKNFDSRVAGISWNQLREVNDLMVIAGGEKKNKSLFGALNSGIVDVLITLASNLDYILEERTSSQ